MMSPQLNPQVANTISLEICWEVKNHQGGLHDSNDESGGKMFAVPNSLRCQVKRVQNYLTINNYGKPPDIRSLCFVPAKGLIRDLSANSSNIVRNDGGGTSNAMFDELAERSLMSPLAGTKRTYVRLALIIYCQIFALFFLVCEWQLTQLGILM